MKTPIAVTLIIVGGLLVMTPALSDYFYQRNVVALMSHPGITSVNLDGKMGDLYRIGCWLTGSVMVGIAVLCSLFVRHESAEHKSLVATQAA
ncbi:MAG TPA: hypothetical protein VGI03_15900 [Verrucomicrobiae bacterium]|jgi:hypothetical protein